MGKPKKRTTSTKTGMRRSHHLRKLANVVNGRSPVKAYVSDRQRAKNNEKSE